jgi:transposase
VSAAVAALRDQRASLQQQAAEFARDGVKQKVLTEPEARLMRGSRGHQVAYNAQTAVDAKHHLIVAFELTNEGNDQQQLHPMALAAQQALEGEALTVVADTGYSNGEHASQCEEAKITAVVPRPETVNTKGAQYFSRDVFSYDRDGDSWRCPAGETLTCRKLSRTQQRKEYWTDACGNCPLKSQCTKATKRVIVRGFHEDAREAMHRRAVADPAWMKLRKETAEHPFGTIKWLMGHPRFLLRGLIKARSELALTVFSYNLKRAIAVLGAAKLLAALQPAPS